MSRLWSNYKTITDNSDHDSKQKVNFNSDRDIESESTLINSSFNELTPFPVKEKPLAGRRSEFMKIRYSYFQLIGIGMIFTVTIFATAFRESSKSNEGYNPSMSYNKEAEERDFVVALQESATITAENAAVATDHELCSAIGKDILEMGGNAVDSAVSAALCLGVVNPVSSGLGGGAFILVHMLGNDNGSNPKRSVEVIDARETAPAAATFDMYDNLPPESSTEGGLAVAIPAELKGLEVAHKRHGVLPWKTLVLPAITLAEQGFKVRAHLGDAIQRNEEKIRRNDELCRVLSKDGKRKELLKTNDVLKQPVLGSTLRKIMQMGSAAIYKGDLATKLAHEVQENGGIITFEDIQNYTAVVRDPLIAYNVGGYDIIGIPPPSSGGATLIGIARFLLGYSTPYAGFFRTLSQHRLVEAMKHSFAIRMSLSDPLWNTVRLILEVSYIIRCIKKSNFILA